MLAFFSYDPRLNPADAYSLSVNFVFEKNENKQKEAGVGPLKKQKSSVDVSGIRTQIVI